MALALVFGTYLRTPALSATFLSDDWDHYAMSTGVFPNRRAAWDLFNFVSADTSERQALLSSGRLPWWSDPRVQLGFLRPLSSLSLRLDYAHVSSENAQLRAHCMSAAWWTFGAAGIAAIFHRLLPPLAAATGVLLYALDDAHALPIAWIASRSELMAVAILGWALWAHVSWERYRQRRYRVLSLVLVWLGMLCGEHAVAMFAYFVAFALARNQASLRARLVPLMPLAAPTFFYVSLRAAAGYGVSGSSFYVDPISEPERFLRAMVLHIPVLAGELGFGYAADHWYAGPPWLDTLRSLKLVPTPVPTLAQIRAFQWCFGLLSFGCAIAACVWLRKPSSPAHSRPLAWLITGALLSLIPLSTALPMTRLTVAPSVAFHAAFGWLAVHAGRQMIERRSLMPRVLAGLVCVLPLSIHGLHAAVRGRSLSTFYAASSHIEQQWVANAQLDHESVSNRHLIVLSAHDGTTRFSLPFVRRFAHASVPQTSEMLLPPFTESVGLARPDTNILEVWTSSNDTFSDLRNSAYRLEDTDFRPGEHIPGERFSVVILATHRGLPTRLRFVFARQLDDPSYVFAYPTSEGLQPFRLPQLNETVELRPPREPRPL